MGQAIRVAVLFDRCAVVAVEGLGITQPAGHEEIEQRPELAEMVFQRCTGQAQPLPGVEPAHGLRGLARRVLDVLRFIEHQQVQRLLAQRFDVSGQQCVAGQQEVVFAELGEVLASAAALQGQYPKLRGEACGLVLPVGNQAGRHHHQRRAVEAAGLLLDQQVGEGLQRLAQAHVVPKNSSTVQLAQGLQPGHPLQLIGPQRCTEPTGRREGRLA